MSRKSGIATYGYRDQNDFQSSIGLVCETISNSNSSSDKDIIRQLVESVNIIFNKAIVDATYNGSNKEFEFNNYYGSEVDRFKFPYIVNTAEYDTDTKKIVIKFEDETIDPIEIDLSSIVISGDVESMLLEEISARTKADQDIWDAIGDLSGSTETSGKTLLELIEEEISARTKVDQDIWDAIGDLSGSTETSGKTLLELIEEEISARTSSDEEIMQNLDEEISARTQGDDDLLEKLLSEKLERESADTEIWEAIISGSSIVEVINEEIDNRISADTNLWEAISALTESAVSVSDKIDLEISARTENYNDLTNLLDEEINARTQSDVILFTKINNEISERESADTALWEALSAETDARISGDTDLSQKISNEKDARIYWFGQLSGAITTEASVRESADTELWEVINNNKNNIDVVSGTIETEKAERIASDNFLSGAIETEKAERIASDNFLSGAIETEKAERISESNFLSGSVLDNQVHVERITTDLEPNLREEYVVVNNKNEVLGQHIRIYKDKTLESVTLEDHDDSGHNGQFMKFTYITATGSRDIVYVNVSDFLAEAEFKDGFIVNRSGEVRILIDRASNPHLTVSEEGLRLSGVTEIETGLTAEISSRQTDVARIEANLETERATRELSDDNLSNRITNEENAREIKDDALELLITQEIGRAKSAESAITYALYSETNNRELADEQLNNTITIVGSRLTTETSERISEDTLIRTDISLIRTDCGVLDNRISNVNDRLTDEITRAQSAEQTLQNVLNTKANSADVYYKTDVDRIFATKDEIPSDFYSRDDVDIKDGVLRAMITAETSARESEDANLNRSITGETQRAITVENTLSGRIETIKNELSGKVVDVSSDLTINVDKTDSVRPKLSVNISSEENQIIKVNADGLYAKASLDYDEEHNILLFSTSNSNPKSIELKTKSSIDNIYYNALNETIVIEYTVNGSRKEDVIVPVGDLIDEWRVADGHQNAIELKKVRSVSGDDVLSAKLYLNTSHSDNVAMIDDNALYVSKNAIISSVTAEIAALTARITALENALSAATEEHTVQSQRITQVEQVNASQDNQIGEINTKNQSQDEALSQLLDYLSGSEP